MTVRNGRMALRLKIPAIYLSLPPSFSINKNMLWTKHYCVLPLQQPLRMCVHSQCIVGVLELLCLRRLTSMYQFSVNASLNVEMLMKNNF